jgi:hypothetical protein
VDQFRLFPLRLGPDLELQLEHWRSLRPKLAEARSVDELKDILDKGAVAAAPTCAALYPDNPRTT